MRNAGLEEAQQESRLPGEISITSDMQIRKQQLELDMEQQTGSKQKKEYIKAVYCHPAYLTYIEYIMRNAWLDEAQAGIKTAGRCVGEGNGNPFQYSCLENPRNRGARWAAVLGLHRVGHD